MDEFRDGDASYECVEPRLGEELWRLAQPDLESAARAELSDHLSVCAACRLELAAQDRLVGAIADGSVPVPSGGRSHRFGRSLRWIAGGSALALAAGLALIFVLPPTDPTDTLLLRGDSPALRIERPLPREVVLSRRPRVAWTPVADATGYRVELRSADGPYVWSGDVIEPAVTVPDSAAAPRGEQLRVVVKPVPEYLDPGEGMTVSFRTGTVPEFVGYRLRAAPRWLWGLVGLGVLGLALVGRARGRSRALVGESRR